MIEAPVTLITRTATAAVSVSSISAAVSTSTPTIAAPIEAARKGEDGHSPVVTMIGDQIAVDGVITGPHLTGQQGIQGSKGDPGESGPQGLPGADGQDGTAGHSPTVTMVGDQISIDGVVSGPHLTGPDGAQGIKGDPGDRGLQGLPGSDGQDGADGHSPVITMIDDQIAVDGVITGPHLTGPQGVQGVKGDPGDPGDTNYKPFAVAMAVVMG